MDTYTDVNVNIEVLIVDNTINPVRSLIYIAWHALY